MSTSRAQATPTTRGSKYEVPVEPLHSPSQPVPPPPESLLLVGTPPDTEGVDVRAEAGLGSSIVDVENSMPFDCIPLETTAVRLRPSIGAPAIDDVS